MAYLALIVAVLALVAAGVLWYLGSKSQPQPPSEAETSAEKSPSTNIDAADTHGREVPEETYEDLAVVEERQPEPEPELEPAPKPEPEPEPEPAPEPEDDSKARRRFAQRPGLPSGNLIRRSPRRERRAWAEKRGFDFERSDDNLVDQWSRGAAATGVAPKDIASGAVDGRELLLMNLDGTNVMALRTGEVSDVVVDIRRDGFQAKSSEDLLETVQVAGFTVFATDVGPAERLIDDRVVTALEALPETVTAVWFESDWVLAQTTSASDADDWDAMVEPMELLANAARVLPPRSWRVLEFRGPTREMAPPMLPVEEEDEAAMEEADPLVIRPEEPLELPTRTTGMVHGTVEPHPIGGDEVEAIADGTEAPERNDGTRVTRHKKPPSIFDD